MDSLQPLIVDLALILILAGVVTIVFKKLRQPVVLGYIVAGFLASPNFHYLPSIADVENIDIWAQIGIIVLLFTLGLEFNFKKLLNVGGTAFTTALTIALGMIAIGYTAGQMMGFTVFDSIFLGAMLSMSSTMIIIKAFNDLGMQQQKFTQTVFGVLIVQDLLAVVLMVVLSSVAAGSVEGGELLNSVVRLVFFLILWFVIGTFIIPTFIRSVRKHLNNETLLIVSMGLCFGMVVIATYAGFSSALGAFVMGSILSSANEVERIERIVQPIKDLFGAVFFISVGMLVNVDALAEYAVPIVILSLIVIIGQSFLATAGMLLSGQPLRTAMQSGFSLSQIGEFSFIIASLGISLGVMDSFLYPIVVAVSVVTTFTTPYMIKLAIPCYNKLAPRIPERIMRRLDEYAASKTTIENEKTVWKQVITNYLSNIIIYGTLTTAIIIVSKIWLYPLTEEWLTENVGKLLATIITLLAMSPFLWAITMRRTNSNILRSLWSDGRSNQVPIMLLIVIRYVIAGAFVIGFLLSVYSYIGMIIGLILFLLMMKTFSKDIQKQFRRLEKGFLDNLNQRERSKKGIDLIHNLHIARMKVHEESEIAGSKLADLNLRKRFGVNLVSILRGTRRINIPGGEARLFPGDIIGVIGTEEQIGRFLPVVECGEEISCDGTSEEVTYTYIPIYENSSWIGKSTAELGLRNKYHCLLVGIERGIDSFLQPDGTIKIEANDILWVAGEQPSIKAIKEIAQGKTTA